MDTIFKIIDYTMNSRPMIDHEIAAKQNQERMKQVYQELSTYQTIENEHSTKPRDKPKKSTSDSVVTLSTDLMQISRKRKTSSQHSVLEQNKRSKLSLGFKEPQLADQLLKSISATKKEVESKK